MSANYDGVQQSLFASIIGNDEGQPVWTEEWVGMPEYLNSEANDPVITATIKFRSQADFDLFLNLVKCHLYDGEKPFDGMQSVDKKTTWFPLREKASKYRYE